MLFGLIKTEDRTPTFSDAAHTVLPALYDRAGNLEKELESLARREPLTLLTPEQVRGYNHILVQAKQLIPKSVVLKEDAPTIEEGDLPHAETFYRIMHTAIVPTLHNALPEDITDNRP